MLSSVLSSLSKFLWSSSPSGLVQLPSGEFYIYKPPATHTPLKKPRKDCLFQNSTLTVARKDGEQERFQYDLIIERVTEEGEESAADDVSVMSFDVCDALEFSRVTSDSGGIAFQWKAALYERKKTLDSHVLVLYEWIPDKSISAHTLQLFHYTMAQCLFERSRGISYTQASDRELDDILQGKKWAKGSEQSLVSESFISAKEEEANIIYTSPPVPFFVFDPTTGHFVSKHAKQVCAQISSNEKYQFSLVLVESGSETLARVIVHQQPIQPTAVQHVDRPTCSFVWCLQAASTTSIETFSLKFTTEPDLFAFTNLYARCVYEILNQESIQSLSKSDISYLVNPFLQDIDMKDASESEDDLEEEEEELEVTERSLFSPRSKHSSTIRQSEGDSDKNRQLVIGYRYDRSFVSRGSSIGVFKSADDDSDNTSGGLSFVTNIKGVETIKNHTPFSPSKLMLYDQDSSLLLMNPTDQQTVYRMDLEVGKVVDEWKVVEDYSKVTNIVADQKYAAMTPNKTFIGMNTNSIFRIDPRLSGTKQVDQETRQYSVKNDFTCGATTGHGELAIASKKGDIRLFNKLDKRAKTLLPGFGDPILGLDVTEDGRYIVATCKTYLLFICTQIHPDSESQIITGFTKSMPADNKPLPKRLTLKPEHIAYMTGGISSINFTEAHFSTGDSEGRAIIASTGPYVITWPVKSILRGRIYDYQIKKYSDTIVADNFKYGQDNNIIVTLPDQVTMIDKSVLLSPKNLKSFNSIVDSPF
jgi:hypothetical protein